MNKITNIILLVVFFFLSSCTGSDLPKSLQENQVTEITQSPTQDITKGVVTGKLVTNATEDRNGLMIYLGDIITDSNGYIGGFLDKQKAPSGLVNGSDGVFTIGNVPPGQYALIVYEVVFGGQAYKDEKGNTVIIKVEPGETTDLGEINFPGY